MPVRGIPERLASLSGLANLAVLAILSGLAGLALSACTFSPPGLNPGPGADASDGVDSATPSVDASVTDGRPAADAGPPGPGDVVHVPGDGWFGGPTPVVWNEDVFIDTTAGTLMGAGTEGLALDVREHEPPGSEIAILHLGDLTVGSAATVRVVGNLPFVVISSGNIRLEGLIDAGARRQTPGAGGAAPGQGGPGAGRPGSHDSDGPDSGGGGAGHATAGARGSDGCTSSGGPGNPSDCTASDRPRGGLPGEPYGDPAVTTLTGGAGGGAGGLGRVGDVEACTVGAGGAGGGAVQLYAVGVITVASGGGINVGGGGGAGGDGTGDGDPCAPPAGGGGGSGGVIYLQAERIELAGTLAANGGGGGAGATQNANPNDGSDGGLNATPAPGGNEGGGDSSNGGTGGAGTTAPTQSEDDDENGGGGGGAVGRVVLHCNDFDGAGLVSPAPERTAGCAP